MEQQSNKFDPTYLWDEGEKIPGYIELEEKMIRFHFKNFRQSKLSVQIDINHIVELKLYKLYNLITQGVEVLDSKGRKFIFILDEPIEFFQIIRERLNPT
jgi:hypothetical protein